MICLVKTRANEPRIRKFCKKFKRKWEWAACPANGYSGGIIILWKKDLGQVTPLCFSRNVMHIIASDGVFKTWLISIVYNGQTVKEQQSTWLELNKLTSVVGPWIILGDFNTVRTHEERKGGKPNWTSGMKSDLFNSFIIHNNLVELKFSGPEFTWCNNQRGSSRIWTRLDRALCNNEWLNEVHHYHLSHLARCQSDHSPLLLNCKKVKELRLKPFRFDNNWTLLPECHRAVSGIWRSGDTGNPMHAISHKFHTLKKDLSKNCMGYSQNLARNIK
ncbi:hypothetical protein J5N97_025782 [Dioscorea zingiberensis]|uniref:Endonuclease/exonuclease/phosphatase domain-containing protein n=1 Tax=Dioscorea zingiberensis TaxID=325984 RepID=A0A9D5C292_9LILI|nr:hypothetical protein J5N97_025782 [Dioscorea zingiberensis]